MEKTTCKSIEAPLAVEVKVPVFEFRPVNVARDRQTCIKFYEENFIYTFGDLKRAHGIDGSEKKRYLEVIEAKAKKDPWSVVHGWHLGRIVACLELDQSLDNPSLGYVNFVHIHQDYRGKGCSWELDRYMRQYFKKNNYQGAMVAVGRENRPAIGFYKKFGWQFYASRSDIPQLDFWKLSNEELWKEST